MTDFSQPVDEISVRVAKEQAGTRIDSYLPRRFDWRSRQYFLGLLADGTVRVNGTRVKKSYRVCAGDEVTLALPAHYRTQFDYAGIELSILHEDDTIVVIDKPGNLAVQPTGRYIHRNLLNRLRFLYREERGEPHVEPCIVHRLDRETSGVIVFAKSRDVARMVTQQFADKQASKRYRAIVHGRPSSRGTIDAPLLSTEDQHVIVDARGKPARTHFERHRSFGCLSLVELGLETGRQHQLRVHLAHIGHPIVSDELYGLPSDRTRRDLPDRQMLHAARLELTHPNGQRLRFEAPLPQDMLALVARSCAGASDSGAST